MLTKSVLIILWPRQLYISSNSKNFVIVSISSNEYFLYAIRTILRICCFINCRLMKVDFIGAFCFFTYISFFIKMAFFLFAYDLLFDRDAMTKTMPRSWQLMINKGHLTPIMFLKYNYDARYFQLKLRVWETSEHSLLELHTAQKMKFSTKDFFSKCDQIHIFLRIWSHLLKKSLIQKWFFCAVANMES